MIYTTDELIRSVKSRGLVPTNQRTFTDEDITLFANEELFGKVVSLITKQNEEYFVKEITTDLVTGKSKYRLSTRAMGQGLRDIYYKDGSTIDHLTKLNREDLYSVATSGSRPLGYFLEGNYVRFIPADLKITSGQVVTAINFRPNQLVASNRARKVTGFTTNTITVNSVPTHFVVGAKIDVISQFSGNEHLFFDLTITAISGNTITFDSNDIADLEINDWVCVAGESPVAQIPEELHPYLVERTLMRIYSALNDHNAVAGIKSSLIEMEDALETLTADRTPSHPTKIKNNQGLLRSRSRLIGR